MNIYRMSESYSCPKVLGAQKLGYEPIVRTEASEHSLDYYSQLEAVVAGMLEREGYELEQGGTCLLCQSNGIHVHIKSFLISLVGHLDRRIKVNGGWYPCEIKTLGRFSFDRFERKGFEEFMEYAGQEACYLEAEGKPGI